MVLRSPATDRSARSRAVIDFASAAIRSGNMLGARQALQNRLLEDPADAEALAKLAEIAANQNRVEEATVFLQGAISVDPSFPRRLALIRHFIRFGYPALALGEIEKLPPDARNAMDVRELEAAVLGKLGFHERGIRLYRQIVREKPSDLRCWFNLATSLRTVGRVDEAVKALERVTRSAPTAGEAWWRLANLKAYKFTPSDLAAMRQALRQQLLDEDALHLHFALGKVFEDRADYEESFRHYAAANAIRARAFSPEQMCVSPIVDESISCFTRDLFERNKGAGCLEKGPIFVVGLHRSGSTLVEQILASHSQIEGTAELPVLGNIWTRLERASQQSAPRAIAALSRSELKAIGEEYLEETKSFRKTGCAYFVDKMPANWISAALIRLALPNAAIIDARRHPMACGFSNFKQHYSSGVGYSYSLTAVGTFYRDYWRFMRHLDEVQPGAVHRLINERLVADPEREVGAMLEYLGLSFEPSCLEFHRNERAVQTPSAEQVRQPINRRGVDQWKHYERWLGDLADTVRPLLEQWDR